MNMIIRKGYHFLYTSQHLISLHTTVSTKTLHTLIYASQPFNSRVLLNILYRGSKLELAPTEKVLEEEVIGQLNGSDVYILYKLTIFVGNSKICQSLAQLEVDNGKIPDC